MVRARRRWVTGLGYTYDGVTPTKCQCNISGGKCICGHYEEERRAEQARLDEEGSNETR
jgi:hypothetical protein